MLLLFVSPKMSPDLIRVKIQRALQASEKSKKLRFFGVPAPEGLTSRADFTPCVRGTLHHPERVPV
jgi:hypothetical protein